MIANMCTYIMYFNTFYSCVPVLTITCMRLIKAIAQCELWMILYALAAEIVCQLPYFYMIVMRWRASFLFNRASKVRNSNCYNKLSDRTRLCDRSTSRRPSSAVELSNFDALGCHFSALKLKIWNILARTNRNGSFWTDFIYRTFYLWSDIIAFR